MAHDGEQKTAENVEVAAA